MHKLFVLTTFLLCSFFASAKDVSAAKITHKNFSETVFVASPIDSLNWKLLGMIKFIKKADKEYGEVMYPEVSALLKQKNGKRMVGL